MSNQIKTYESELLGEKYYEIKHKSGLPIYVFPKEMSTTHALLAVKYGSIHNVSADGKEPPFPHGIAHFLEHKLFSNEDGSDSFEHFAAMGADANAYTSHARTVYLFSATERPAEPLAELIDFVTHPYFTAETVQKEQGIIAEEIRMCRDNPYDRCYYNMLKGLYHNHPVRNEICGSVRSIGEITDQALYDCYAANYRLPNMVLVVCGNMSVEEVLAVADAHLPEEAEAYTATKLQIDEPDSICCERIVTNGQVAMPIYSIGIKEVTIPKDPIERVKRDACMGILLGMLFTISSELYNYLYDNELIAPDLSTDYVVTDSFGFLQISGEANDPDAVLSEILKYIDGLRERGISKEDFERNRCVEVAEVIKGFDSTEEIANNLLDFVFEETELFDYTEIIQSIRIEDVTQLLNEFFDPARITLSIVRPMESRQEEGE